MIDTEYDVCIVGSGAGGGMAAYALTKAGAKVVMLEAGGEWYASKNSQMLTPSFVSPRRGASTRLRPFGEFDEVADRLGGVVREEVDGDVTAVRLQDGLLLCHGCLSGSSGYRSRGPRCVPVDPRMGRKPDHSGRPLSGRG